MKKIILFGIVMICLAYSVFGVCTVTLDKETYSLGETATVTASCSEQAEKNTDYTMNWTNSSVFVLQLDTGTTPAVAGTNFFHSFVINSSYVDDYGSSLNVSLIGVGLEGYDNATIQNAQTQDLIIKNTAFTSIVLLGKRIGISFDVEDENGKEITNALCTVHILDNDDRPIDTSHEDFLTIGGHGSYVQLITKDSFNEDTSYKSEVHCFCGSNNTNQVCIDEDGVNVYNSIGTTTGSFTTNKWLDVNTVTDKSLYNMKEEIFVCVNVTNVNASERVPMHIYHQIRCSKEEDNDDDLDRVLIMGDNEQPDERGISVSATQMQCKRFIIPEPKYLQGRNSECYASTTVWVLNQEREKIISYATTSPVFNITSDELNLNPDWERKDTYEFNSIINLSASAYSDYNGSGTGNIDLKLQRKDEFLRSYEQDEISDYTLLDIYSTHYIKNITAYNSTTEITPYLEFLEDGSIEIELRDVDISTSGWYNVTIIFNNYEERYSIALENQSSYQSYLQWLANLTQLKNHSAELARAASALEGIENKTGTFHFDVDCPTSVVATEITCTITAYIESGEVQKEVDFTCYVGDQFSTRNWNSMVTTASYSTAQTFDLTQLGEGYHAVTCQASYYNLGSRTDTFYDSFSFTRPLAGTGGGGSYEEKTTLKKMEEGLKESLETLKEKENWLPALVIFTLCIAIITNKNNKKEAKKSKKKEKLIYQ